MFFHVLATANSEKVGRGFGKNAGEWTRMAEISKEEIPGSRPSLYVGKKGGGDAVESTGKTNS